MKTKILNKEDILEIVSILNQGGIVALPTDTVYGLAVRFDRLDAIEKMKKAKQRPESKPFPMMVSAKSQIEEVAKISRRDNKLIQRWMPGAMTFVFNKKDSIDPIITNHFSTIGIRMPDDQWLTEIIRRVGVPLLVPSANISNEAPATTSIEVLAQMDGLIDAVVVGKSGGSQSSTVIDASQNRLVCLRQGPISLADVELSLQDKKQLVIALASDHGGFHHKEKLKEALLAWDYEVLDFGTSSEESTDYSDTVYPAAKAVSEGRADCGIVLCGTGIGASITANKVAGIRCALVSDVAVAEITRLHNDSNVLALGGRFISEEKMYEIAKIWLQTPFSKDERHQRRISKIGDIEKLEGVK